MRISRPLTLVFLVLAFFAGPRFCTVVWAALACIALALASKELIDSVRERNRER